MPIMWYSKYQSTVELSVFGAEFTALRLVTEAIMALRYKLRMFGLPIDGPANVFCDNKSVVKNTTNPASTLNKRHNIIAYHKVRELVAAGIIQVAHKPGKSNMADALTKPLNGEKLKACARCMLY